MLSSIRNYLANQARKPTGWFGRTVATRVFDHENKQMQQFALQVMDPKDDDRILEVGFGSGYFISELITQIKDGKMCGIDISRDMVVVASKQNRQWIRKGKLELKQASIEKIPYPDNHFDKVFTANTIYFWPDPENNIKEVKRVLKPGGEFYCAMRMKNQMEAKGSVVRDNKDIFQNLYTKEKLKRLFETAGFHDFEIHINSEENETVHIVYAK